MKKTITVIVSALMLLPLAASAKAKKKTKVQPQPVPTIEIVKKVNDKWQATNSPKVRSFGTTLPILPETWKRTSSQVVPVISSLVTNGRVTTIGAGLRKKTIPSGYTKTTASRCSMCSSETGRFASRHISTCMR